MQTEFSFTKQINSLEKYKPLNVNRKEDKLWFSYINSAGSIITAYYDFALRSFKSVVEGDQYGEGVAIRSVIAKPVVESMIQK